MCEQILNIEYKGKVKKKEILSELMGRLYSNSMRENVADVAGINNCLINCTHAIGGSKK